MTVVCTAASPAPLFRLMVTPAGPLSEPAVMTRPTTPNPSKLKLMSVLVEQASVSPSMSTTTSEGENCQPRGGATLMV